MLVFKNPKKQGSTISDWRQWTQPKQPYQWKTGRSSMELARAWFTSRTPQIPAEIEALLSSNSLTTQIQFYEGEPEFVTPLPERGEGRNHDLLLRGITGQQKVIAGIEGKADEPYGNDTIGSYFQRMSSGTKPTRAPQRINTLLEIVFGPQATVTNKDLAALQYQLLTGVAGAVIQAAKEGAPIALFIVHEFHTHATEMKKHQENQLAYEAFIAELFGNKATGPFYGPKLIQHASYAPNGVELFMGKAEFKW